MRELLTFGLVSLSAVFFIVDPFAVVPVYLAITQSETEQQKRATAWRAAITSGLTLSVFAAAGQLIFKFFGISLPAFKIAGGLLCFLVALDMMQARPSRTRSTPEEEKEGAEKADVAIIPLAIPLLSGPGAIATVMVLMAKTQGAAQSGLVFGAIAVTTLVTWATLRGAGWIERKLSRTFLNVMMRVMGLILAAIAVEFVLSGLHEAFPAAHAAPVDRPRELADEGRRAFAEGKFEDALDRYEYTMLLSESPTVAFNIAACLERLGRYREAAVAFTRYGELAPQKRDSVRARIDEDIVKAGEKPGSVAEESKRATAAARYAFERKDHATAASELLRAYALAPSALTALHLADVLEAAGQYGRAAMALDRYVELGEENELDDDQLTRTRARADALRYRKGPAAPPPPASPPARAAPARRAADDEGITVALHGSANNDDKQRRCIAAVRRAGYQLDLAPRITAVLTLGKENRLRIVDRERGVMRDAVLPRWGMEPLCVEAARQASAMLDATR